MKEELKNRMNRDIFLEELALQASKYVSKGNYFVGHDKHYNDKREEAKRAIKMAEEILKSFCLFVADDIRDWNKKAKEDWTMKGETKA